MNNKKTNKEEKEKISNSRAMGIIILIGLLLVFQIVTFIFHKLKDKDISLPDKKEFTQPPLFKFNPNNIKEDSLILLGFSAKQAKSIINYREKGGKFFKPEDFKKLYVVDSIKFNELKDYIYIPKKQTNKKLVKTAIKNYNKSKDSSVIKKDTLKPLQTTVNESVYGKKFKKEEFKCNLNLADSSDLVKLYGIGPYFAKKILRYRERLGGSFVDIMQLLEIDGFDQERFDKIKTKIYINEADIKKISFWEVDKDFLEKNPYIGAYTARGILVFLQINGEQKNLSGRELLDKMLKDKVINNQTYIRLKSYVE